MMIQPAPPSNTPSMPPRCVDWHARLILLIESRRSLAFAWGSNDCCLWVADAVLAMTGHDPAVDLRGTYCTARGATSALRRVGGLEGAGARCGAPIAALCAATGDIGLVHDSARGVLAVCAGEVWLVISRAGLAMLPLQSVQKSWRVA